MHRPTPDRKRLVVNFGFGPRYGRGYIYRVIGQGTRGRHKGRLHLDPTAASWIS